jgi:hypothetical protein
MGNRLAYRYREDPFDDIGEIRNTGRNTTALDTPEPTYQRQNKSSADVLLDSTDIELIPLDEPPRSLSVPIPAAQALNHIGGWIESAEKGEADKGTSLLQSPTESTRRHRRRTGRPPSGNQARRRQAVQGYTANTEERTTAG